MVYKNYTEKKTKLKNNTNPETRHEHGKCSGRKILHIFSLVKSVFTRDHRHDKVSAHFRDTNEMS